MTAVTHIAYRTIRYAWVISIVGLLIIGIVGIGFLALQLGTPYVAPAEVWNILLHGEGERIVRVVVLQVRLPRLVLGGLVGAMLALTGVVLQDALHNALAGPELLGVSAGAALVMAAIIILNLPIAFVLQPWLALVGGFVSGSLLLRLAGRQARNSISLLLIGAALTTLLNAAVVTLMSLGSQASVSLLFFFLMGSLANRTWEHVQLLAPWALVGMPAVLLYARTLNVLRLGDDVAEGLGIAVVRTRLLLLGISALLVAAVVAVCGPIGWVALLAPHGARRLLGTSAAGQVLPVAALIGALLLISADLLARQALAPLELPSGIGTTLIGGPLLLLLLRRRLGG